MSDNPMIEYRRVLDPKTGEVLETHRIDHATVLFVYNNGYRGAVSRSVAETMEKKGLGHIAVSRPGAPGSADPIPPMFPKVPYWNTQKPQEDAK